MRPTTLAIVLVTVLVAGSCGSKETTGTGGAGGGGGSGGAGGAGGTGGAGGSGGTGGEGGSGGTGGTGGLPIYYIGHSRDDATGGLVPGALIDIAETDPPTHSSSDFSAGFSVPLQPDLNFEPVFSADNYRPTRNPPITLTTISVTQDAFLVSKAEANLQYAVLSLTPTAGTAMLFVDLMDHDRQPLENIPATDIQLVNDAQQPLGRGPYFLAAGGIIDPNQTTSAAVDGRARAVVLDVPPGPAHFVVTTQSDGKRRTLDVTLGASGATLGSTANSTPQ